MLATVEDLNIHIEEKSSVKEENVEELIALGGKRQFPYMVDGDTSMYESDDIVNYLVEKYGKGVHNVSGDDTASEVCPVELRDSSGGE